MSVTAHIDQRIHIHSSDLLTLFWPILLYLRLAYFLHPFPTKEKTFKGKILKPPVGGNFSKVSGIIDTQAGLSVRVSSEFWLRHRILGCDMRYVSELSLVSA